MYEIDDDVPVPERRDSRPRMYPFADIEVGQSFFVPAGDNPLPTVRNRVLSAARYARASGLSFRTALRTENGVPGVRCWRVE